MTSRAVDPRTDPARPGAADVVSIELDGRTYEGLRGQSAAGILLAHGVRSWRTTSSGAQPRGVFCGIGVCFDCLVTVDGRRDVRACLFRPEGGEVLTRQHDALPLRREES
jgi:hypothetical protein